MARRRVKMDLGEDDYNEVDDGGHKAWHKRQNPEFIDDVTEEADEDEEENAFDGCRGRSGKKRRSGLQFFNEYTAVAREGEEEEDDCIEDNFIDTGAELPEEDDGRPTHYCPLLPHEDDREDLEACERKLQEWYCRSSSAGYDEGPAGVEQQALLPSIRDSKLWMVNCVNGCEREVAFFLMKKCLDKGPELQIRSVIALDHLKSFIYIEADKVAHVKKACKGMQYLPATKILLLPVKEMTDVLIIESKGSDVSRDSWVRMKTGTYKGDFAKVLPLKLMFNDGFLHKKVSMRSVSTQNVQRTFDELEKFQQLSKGSKVGVDLSTSFANRKKGHFMKGDRVVVNGDLKNLKGRVVNVEEDIVHVKPEEKGLPVWKTIAIISKELRKCFELGDHVKVVSGVRKGATGQIVSVEGHVVIIFSVTTNEHLHVFADDVVLS